MILKRCRFCGALYIANPHDQTYRVRRICMAVRQGTDWCELDPIGAVTQEGAIVLDPAWVARGGKLAL